MEMVEQLHLEKSKPWLRLNLAWMARRLLGEKEKVIKVLVESLQILFLIWYSCPIHTLQEKETTFSGLSS